MGHVRQAASPIFTGITTCGIESYTHKRPLHGYYAPPLYEKIIVLFPLSLTSWILTEKPSVLIPVI